MAVYTTIDNPELYFQVKIWTGTGSSNALTLDGSENMQPDYVMIKQRSGTQQWNGYDSVRGVQKYLGWNTGILENTQTQGLTAFGSDGFTVGTDDMVNKSSSTYVAYCWKESATAGFDIVTYTGTGSAKTENHSLSAKPHWIIVKNRSDNDNYWQVQHKSLGATKNMLLNDTNAVATVSTFWNDTEPTTSVFSVGTHDDTNENTDSLIAYLWSEKQGFSKFGSYVGNGDTDGAFVYTGFRPAMVITKKTNGTTHWTLNDSKRLGYNPAVRLYPNLNNAEESTGEVDLLSNGFKARTTNDNQNGSGDSYIYMAFAEAPFVNSKGVPANAR